ncbi:MAG: hypothetical protein K5906_01195 [Bacilli bacterium]|nr:hypothetical protein [Bacilli bacterium]
MRKASHILYMVGYVMSVLLLFIFIGGTVVFFIISSSGYTQTIIEQLQSGKITTDFVGSVEEQAAMIQKTFFGMAWSFLVISLISIAKTVFAVLANTKKLTSFYITSLVLSIVGGDTLFIIASIFGIVANKQENESEEINVSY